MRRENERETNVIPSGDERAVSPLIGATVLVALTVALGAVVFVSAVGFTNGLDEPRLGDCVPSSHAATSVYACDERVIEVSLSEDPLAASGSAEVRINHVFGEPVASEDVRIEIDAPGGKATIEGLREGGIDDGFVRHGLKPANAEVFEDPDNIIDSSGFTSKIPAVMEESDTAFFRLNTDAKLDQGPAEFEITHTPTGEVILDEELSEP
jgi:FlaG/FlaF family flagellin (archaellin)